VKRPKPRLLLLACYELGHQPLSLAWPVAFLKSAGYAAATLDLAVEPFSDQAVREADIVGIAASMHTALRLGVQAAQRVRALNPRAHLCFYGLYAGLNADLLLGGARTRDAAGRLRERGLADSVIAGEYEAPLIDLVRCLELGGDLAAVPGVMTRAARPGPHLARSKFPVPDRATLPAPDRYSQFIPGTSPINFGESSDDRPRLAGYVEATRGCLHTCRHCPIVPIYNGRFFVVPAEVVLADIAQQVEAGARHITFGDPDFLNGPKHSLLLARELHARWPGVTFDFTTKVEHVLKHRALFPEFAALGCAFVVSAIESVSDLVLARLQKGHTAADIDTALAILDSAGIALHPTLVAFTPWTTLDDYLAQIEFIDERGLGPHIPPVQLSIRLLLPPGSPLVHAPDAAEWLGELDAANFTYRWTHPDLRMEALSARVAARVAEADACGEPAEVTFESIRALAYAAAGRPVPPPIRAPLRPAPPRLTENWFC
jgi:radical SAM superfamily enzyme YgiQ (UPF0313 family)